MPTLRGWIIIFVFAIGLAYFGVHRVFPFLAVHDPQKCELLVVEGWIPDYLMADVKTEFESGGYRLLIITGSPITKGEPLAEEKTYPELTRAALLKSGWQEENVAAVPCAEALRDRTYASAIALRDWLEREKSQVACFNIFSRGSHCRRTRMLYQLAFGDRVKVGVIAGKDLRYDSEHWWRSSEGVRDILDETIAYLYARLIFRPD
ncbi:MAG: YdcF family protein [Verrucomicrobia bacterium]|nr:YdcF family protein [Verrucomicrobiota bacterium]